MLVFKDSKTFVVSFDWLRRLVLSCLVAIGIAFLFALISGCSVYKSNGRRTFEDKAPGSVDRQAASQILQNSDSNLESQDTCWTQPTQEPLWSVPEQAQLSVHLINRELIEVCLESENSTEAR